MESRRKNAFVRDNGKNMKNMTSREKLVLTKQSLKSFKQLNRLTG